MHSQSSQRSSFAAQAFAWTAILFGALSAHAAQKAPECWRESQGEAVQDGVFSMTVDVDRISKEELLKFFESANGATTIAGRPRVFGKVLLMDIEPLSLEPNSGIARSEAKRRIASEVEALLAISPAIEASCAYFASPQPGVGVSDGAKRL